MLDMIHITTLPVFSRLCDPATLPPALCAALPAGLLLSQHQLDTYQALTDPGIFIAINTAMTGDGKSLAATLPQLADWADYNTLALYPTNELIEDQHRSAERTLEQWNRPASRVATLYGARLDELYADAETLTRPETLARELRTHKLVLSNPDMLHAILQFHYQQYGRTADHIAAKLGMLFQQLTFDEFHIFSPDQVNAVLTGLLFLYEQTGATLKTLFLSATPDAHLIQTLKRVGLGERMRIISPQEHGGYHHGNNPGPGWRPIIRGSQIAFAPQQAEEWISSHLDDILLPWFRTHYPHTRAALIVNSPATALRLEQVLTPRLRAVGLTVAANTGLTARPARRASYEADLLIGTSTIDVGVDFRINLLMFEAPSAATFVQRLGRLGRHAGFEHNGQGYHFQAFAAYALVPPFVYERLFVGHNGEPPVLTEGATLTREELTRCINEVYPSPARFDHYARLWGRFQAAKVYTMLDSPPIRDTYADVRERLKQRYYDLTGGYKGSYISTALRDWKNYRTEGQELLVTEAQSFRGGSPFDCGLLKPDEGEPLTYDLFWLLANAHLELLDQKAFHATLQQMSDRPFQRGFQAAYFRWRGLRAKPERVIVLLDPVVSAWDNTRHHTAQVLPGIALECLGHDFMNTLNRTLATRRVVGLLVPDCHPQQLRRQVYLPGHFPLHSYCDENNHAGTIAFGRQALLLDSVLRYRKHKTDSGAPIIC